MSKHRVHIRVTPAEVSQMREQRAAGLKVHEIARVHNRDEGFVSRILTGHYHSNDGGPIATRSRFRLTAKDRAEILQTVSVSRHYLGKEPSVAKLARRFSVDPETLRIHVLDHYATWIDRFWSLVDRSAGPESCWPWRGGLLERTGNDPSQFPGRYMDGKKPHRPHRLAFQLTVGPIAAGNILVHTAPLDSRCANATRCCNPLHWMPAKPAGRKRHVPSVHYVETH